MLDRVLDFLGVYAQNYGIIIGFSFAMLEDLIFLGAIFPGETTLLLLGFFAAQGKLSIFYLIPAVILGYLLGDNLGYYLGYHHGRKFLKKFGKYFFFEEDKLHLAEGFYKRHGSKTVLLGKLIGFIRSFVPFTAGMSKMTYSKFFILDFLGTVLSAFFITLLGYFFGSNWRFVKTTLGDIGIIAFIFIAIIIYNYLKKVKSESA
ncbi:MAG: DedA family protein [Patescibacteria group bacterium]|nr:DedA family protein [Patescibacteria group bacterium]